MKNNQISVMLDNNIFNKFLDSKSSLIKFPYYVKFYATEIQLKELMNTQDTTRRNELLSIFNKIIFEKIDVISTQWLSFGNSNFNSRFINDREIEVINFYKEKHLNDALIFLTAEGHNMILISDDKKGVFSSQSRKSSNISILNFAEFSSKYGTSN